MEEVLGNFHDNYVDGGKKEVLDNLEDTMVVEEGKHDLNLVNIGKEEVLNTTSDSKVWNGGQMKVLDDTDMVDKGDEEDDMDENEAKIHSEGRHGPVLIGSSLVITTTWWSLSCQDGRSSYGTVA